MFEGYLVCRDAVWLGDRIAVDVGAVESFDRAVVRSRVRSWVGCAVPIFRLTCRMLGVVRCFPRNDGLGVRVKRLRNGS